MLTLEEAGDEAARPRPLDVWGDATVRVALHVRRGDVMPVDKGDRGAREGAAWGLPLKAQCKAVELAARAPRPVRPGRTRDEARRGRRPSSRVSRSIRRRGARSA